MSSAEAIALARRVFALAKLVGPFVCNPQESSKYPFYFWFGSQDREPSETFLVSKAGGVIRHTCEYSGHNGDSYGDKYEHLAEVEAFKALTHLNARLENAALSKEETRLKESEVNRRKAIALSNLNARLK